MDESWMDGGMDESWMDGGMGESWMDGGMDESWLNECISVLMTAFSVTNALISLRGNSHFPDSLS